MKSKKYLVTSIATATLGLALLTDTAGMSPFSIQQVSAQEKSTPKNGNVKENNLPKQSEKPKDSAPKQSEKPKDSAPKQSEKPQNSSPKQSEKPKSSAPKQTEKPKNSAPKQSEKPKNSAPKQSEKPKNSAPKQSEKPKSSAPKQSEKPKDSTPKQSEKPKSSAPKQSEKPKSSAPKQTEKPKSSTPKQSEKSKDTAPKQSDKQKNTTPKQDKPKSTVKSGWVGSSYYENGVKVTNKWIFDKKVNSYFYLNASGNYVQNAWVGNYYLKSDGKRAKNEWIFDKKANSYFYLNASGNAVRNTWVGNYYLKSDGKRVKSDWIYDKNSGSYYYLTAEGSIARNKWIGNYYLKSDGKMAKNEWVDGGRYYVESDGKMASNKWVDGGRYYVGYDGVRQPKPAAGNPYSAALKRAQGYNGIHLSKKRIYEMLIYEGFNSDTAQYAINHLQADYKANALAKARQYRKYSKLSKTKIYDWLTSPSIDKFTKEEANYAIQKLNLPSEGSYLRNKWVGAYYYKSDGKMAKNEWVDGGRYYVDSNGKMVRDKWVDGGRYYVGYDGVWQPKPAAGNPYSAALKRAQGYNGIHLSKKRIYEMLIYEGFNSDTAQYAINHLQADYKANALAKARQYRKYSKLSKTKIYDWLTSPSIDKFTKEEANYAIQHLDY